MKAVLLVSHGSRSPETKKEVRQLLGRLKRKLSWPIIQYAFLEIEKPSIPQGIERCVRQGAKDILVLLNFLNSGKHVDQDIPRLVNEARCRFPGVRLRISMPIGQHPKIDDLFLDLIHKKF